MITESFLSVGLAIPLMLHICWEDFFAPDLAHLLRGG